MLGSNSGASMHPPNGLLRKSSTCILKLSFPEVLPLMQISFWLFIITSK